MCGAEASEPGWVKASVSMKMCRTVGHSSRIRRSRRSTSRMRSSALILYVPAASYFLPDKAQGSPLGDRALGALAAQTELTFTAVPPGSGQRMGIDRDADGVLDGDEAGARSDDEDD